MWVCTLHDGGGSTAEAVDVEWAVEVASEQEASQFCDQINAHLSRLRSDKWLTYFEVKRISAYDLPGCTPEQIAKDLGRPPGPGEFAVDTEKLAQMLNSYDEEDFPQLKPPVAPVSDDEEQTAIQSILKGLSS